MARLTRRRFILNAAGGLTAAAGGVLSLAKACAQPTVAMLAQQRESTAPAAAATPADRPRTNFLFITADDMNYDSPGVAGCPVPEITPNIDRLALGGMRFVHAHVTVAVCQPSRSVLMTGRYPHRNGAVGFNAVNADVPTLMERLKAAGFLLGILGKVSHLAPPAKFAWDMVHDAPALGNGRDPARYGQFAREFFLRARQEGRPFFLMANSHDPHRPWASTQAERARPAAGKGRAAKAARAAEADAAGQPAESAAASAAAAPSRTYKAEEVTVPGFLPPLPEVRAEMAQYYSSVRRCDDTVGAVLRALDESGQADATLVMLISDNGISQPFAKSNCYLASTRTPWLVRWPGRVRPGAVDQENFISGIDFMPTVLEAAGLPLPDGMDGRSFLPLLRGERQDGRGRAVTVYHKTSAGKEYAMRCIQTARFGYIYNGWSDGRTLYRSEPMGGLSYRAMEAAAASDPAVASRVELLLKRVPEEFYDVQADPCCLKNLVAEASVQAEVRRFRADLARWMADTGDPLAETYRRHLAAAGKG